MLYRRLWPVVLSLRFMALDCGIFMSSLDTWHCLLLTSIVLFVYICVYRYMAIYMYIHIYSAFQEPLKGSLNFVSSYVKFLQFPTLSAYCTVVYVLVALLVVFCLLLQDVVFCWCIYVNAQAGVHAREPYRLGAICKMEEMYGRRIFMVCQKKLENIKHWGLNTGSNILQLLHKMILIEEDKSDQKFKLRITS